MIWERAFARRLAILVACSVIAGLTVFLAARLQPIVLAGQMPDPSVPAATPAPPPPPIVGPPIFPKPNIPQLTEEEKLRALRVVADDPLLQDLLADRDYSITSMGVWHTKELEKIGASIVIALSEPKQVELDWPSPRFDEAGNLLTACGAETAHREARAVRRLYVTVDLRCDQVARITPGPPTLAEMKIGPKSTDRSP